MNSTPGEPTEPEAQPDPAPAPQPGSETHRTFIGPYGLRAGWSLLIYLAIFFFGVWGLFVSMHHPKAEAIANTPMLTRIWIEGGSFAFLFLVSWLMAVIERRKLSAFGLGGQRPLRRLLAGAFWGLLAMSLLIAVLCGLHLLSFDARLLHGFAVLRWGVIHLIFFLLVGLTEEYEFRGYIQFTLIRGLFGLGKPTSPTKARAVAFWTASVLTSALFLVGHLGNKGENWVGLLQVFTAGMLFIVSLWRTGSLWWAVGFHMTWDWAQSFLYGVPDSGNLMQGHLFVTHALGNPLLSGGSDGPEGSIFSILVMLPLFPLLVFFTRSSPPPPLESRLVTRQEQTARTPARQSPEPAPWV